VPAGAGCGLSQRTRRTWALRQGSLQTGPHPHLRARCATVLSPSLTPACRGGPPGPQPLRVRHEFPCRTDRRPRWPRHRCQIDLMIDEMIADGKSHNHGHLTPLRQESQCDGGSALSAAPDSRRRSASRRGERPARWLTGARARSGERQRVFVARDRQLAERLFRRDTLDQARGLPADYRRNQVSRFGNRSVTALG
jgi:hypothetical protein